MDFSYAIERLDIPRIEKLNKLSDPQVFWDDVRDLTKNIKSCHAIRRWEILAEKRYAELTEKNR